MITTFYFLSISGTTISGYPSIVLIMFILTFFSNKNIMCILFVSAFMANALNLIMKLAIYFLSYLNVSIFHLTSTTFLLLLNIILIFLTNSFQFWIYHLLFGLISSRYRCLQYLF